MGGAALATPRRYDAEFKRHAVDLLLKGERPLKTPAKELGVVTLESLRLIREGIPVPGVVHEDLVRLGDGWGVAF